MSKLSDYRSSLIADVRQRMDDWETSRKFLEDRAVKCGKEAREYRDKASRYKENVYECAAIIQDLDTGSSLHKIPTFVCSKCKAEITSDLIFWRGESKNFLCHACHEKSLND